MSFIHEWKELRPIERRRLIGKPLQLPLSCELCYLNESLNHETGVRIDVVHKYQQILISDFFLMLFLHSIIWFVNYVKSYKKFIDNNSAYFPRDYWGVAAAGVKHL